MCFLACYLRVRKLLCFFRLHCHWDIIDKKKLNELNSIEAKVYFCHFFYSSRYSQASRALRQKRFSDFFAFNRTNSCSCHVVAWYFVFSGQTIQRDNTFMFGNCANGNARASRNVAGFFFALKKRHMTFTKIKQTKKHWM